MKLLIGFVLIVQISFGIIQAYREDSVVLDYLIKLSIKYVEKDIVVISDEISDGFLVNDIVNRLNSNTAFLLIDCRFSFDVHVSFQEQNSFFLNFESMHPLSSRYWSRLLLLCLRSVTFNISIYLSSGLLPGLVIVFSNANMAEDFGIFSLKVLPCFFKVN